MQTINRFTLSQPTVPLNCRKVIYQAPPWMAVGKRSLSEPDSSDTSRTGDEMGAVFAQQKKCPLNAVVRAAGFFALSKKEGKVEEIRPWMAVGKRSLSEPDSSDTSRAAGFFALSKKEGKRDSLNV